jgi:hypothetical protein
MILQERPVAIGAYYPVLQFFNKPVGPPSLESLCQTNKFISCTSCNAGISLFLPTVGLAEKVGIRSLTAQLLVVNNQVLNIYG